MTLKLTVEQALQEATSALNDGKFKEAETNYKKVIELKPEFAEAYYNLAVIQKNLGRLDEVEASYKKAIELNPEFAEAHNNLGNTVKELGRLVEAEASYKKAIELNPEYALAHGNMGSLQEKLSKLDEAEASYKKLIELKPNDENAHRKLGIIQYKLGRLEEAEVSYKKTITLNPDYFEDYNNLGSILNNLERLEEAETCYKKAIELNPSYVEAYSNLSITLLKLGKLEETESSYKKVIKLKPDFAEAHYNLANIYRFGKLKEAEISYKKAIELKPNFVVAHYNLGITLKGLGKLEEAEAVYKKTIKLEPKFAEAYNNLGNIQNSLKKMNESLISYEHAISLKPEIDYLLGASLHGKMHLCTWDGLQHQFDELIEKINNGKKVSTPFSLLSLIDDPSIHKKAAEIYSNHKFPTSNFFPKIPHYHKHEKIRIGYFSPDFKMHPVSYLTAELYEIHDRKKFEIHAFSFLDTKDETNIRIKKGVDHFHDVQKISDRDVVKLARSLEIDIAIDLAGYTRDSRPGIFAMSAAPIQVSYLGYNGTMGSDYMNYVIADRTVIPKDKKQHYSEKIVYLPNSYMVNDSQVRLSEKIFTREDFGLPIDGFVFCCFNNHYKINPNTFISWMRILSKVDGSVLWLSDVKGVAMDNLKKEAKKNGIDENRLIFATRLPLKEDHMNRIKLADLFVDSLPFNAHATASDALRMGLPVLTCIGNSFAGRVAASLLNAVKLPEMITATQEQYESLAIKLATHPEKLKAIKDKLVNNLPTTTLYDTPLFAQHLEAAYTIMYEKYQNGLNSDDIEIDS